MIVNNRTSVEALDIIYGVLNYLMTMRQMHTISRMLVEAKIERLSVDTMLAILTATSWDVNSFPERPLFCGKVRGELRERGWSEPDLDRLLTGLI